MQQRQPELNRRLWPFVVQVGVAVASAAVVEWPRLLVGLHRTLPFAVGGDAAVQGAWIAAAVGAGVMVALVLRLWPAWRRSSGVFGGAAATVMAVALVAGTRALLGHVQPDWLVGQRADLLPWLVAPLAAVLAGIAGPVLAERNALTLVWVSLVLGMPLALAHRQARAETVLAEPLQSLQEVAPLRSGLFLSMPEAVPPEWTWALSRSLMARERAVLAVTEDSPEEQWLLRSGWIGLKCRGKEFALMPGASRSELLGSGALAVRASWSEGAAAGARSIAVTAAPAPGPAVASVISPAGVVRFLVDERGNGTPGREAAARLRRLLRPMPPGTSLRVLVVSAGSSEPYGWQDVTLP